MQPCNWRDILPHAFGPFFGQFRSLTPVQEQGIPVILEGHDTLLCSATASGKTEAYVAPVVEMIRTWKAGPASAIIVSPTRALANDLTRRLETRMLHAHVTLGRRTGEYKELVDGKLPRIVIVTPESLDSILARRPHLLRGLRMVVLDEIHVLDGTARGDQLRILLHRLDQVCSTRPQKIAASATVDDPSGLAARYLKNARTVVVPGTRSIKVRRFDGRDGESMVRHLKELADAGLRKILVFCNARRDVEVLSQAVEGCTPYRDAVFSHHGSLAQSHRERTERQFLNAPMGVCFATMTLEMGIDIGSVDYVLLVGPPLDVPALLQRIGRGGRRGDTTRAGYVVDHDAEAFVVEAMFRAGVRGHLLTTPYAFRPGVLVQQALVHAASQVRVEAQDLLNMLPPALRRDYDLDDMKALLDQLVQSDLMEKAMMGCYVPSSRSEVKYDRGVLHSNIADDLTLDVVDRITGDVVGTMDTPDTSSVRLAGRSRDIVKTDSRRVLTDQTGNAGEPRFRSHGIPGVSLRLARYVVEDLGLAKDCVALFSSAGRIVLLHGLGALGAVLLKAAMEKRLGKKSVGRCNAYVLHLADRPDSLPPLEAASCRNIIAAREKSLGRLGVMGPYHRWLPENLRLESLEKALGLDAFLAFYQKLRLEEMDPESLRQPGIAAGLG